MKKIICISTSPYKPFPTRKQNVMNRLKDSLILYFDPPVSVIAPLKDRSAFRRLFAWRKGKEKVRDNISVYSMPPVLPFFNRYRFINKINQSMLAGYVKKRMKEEDIENPYLWCYSPTSCDLAAKIPNKGIIYDCVDRHSAYKGMIDPCTVDRMEKDLAEKASIVFCTSLGLYNTLIAYNKSTRLIPNGAAFEIFSKGQGEADKKGSGPVFGFIGMLQECIDYDCIEALAEAFPHGKIILIGGILPGVDISALKKYSNIVFKGLLPQEDLPDHIRQFDVCLNVFREGRLSRDVSPLKFYEYLATGKPIVSTKVPLQVMDYKDVVYIADNSSDFVVKSKQALEEKDPEKREKRIEYGKNSSWDERVREMENALIEDGIF